MLKVKCNSHISFLKIMGTDESQQKIFSYQELKIDFNMCKIFDKLIQLIWFICTLTSPTLEDFYRNGYQPETKEESCIPEK